MSRPRILIVRTSALGDIVHALPVLTRLRQGLPKARIGWVVEQVFAPLLEGHPDLDAVIPVGLRTWRRRPLSKTVWNELREFWRALDEFSADTVLDLMGSHKAGVIGALTLADSRLGLAQRDRREPSSAIWLTDTSSALGTHAVDRMLSVLDAGQLDLRTDGADEAVDFAGERLPAEPWIGDPPAGRDFALLHPRTAWSNKDYPAESWAEVARSLTPEADLDTWVAWGPGEESAAREVADRARDARVRVLEHLPSLPQLVALSRAARLVLGGDTGPTHLAHALGTPVVCVMGPTDPDRNGPYGASADAVVHRLRCSFCYQRLEDAKACLLNISPTRVVDKALEMLA